MSVELAVRTLLDRVDRRIAPVKPFRAIVTSVSGGLVGIRRPEAASAGTALYARVAGFTLAVNDEVLCVNVGKFPVIIGKIQRAAPTSFGVDAPLVALYSNGTTNAPAGSPDASTTSTSTYAVAFSDTWLLPAGTWTITGMGACSFIHSASLVADYYVEINGSGTLSRTPNLSSTIYTSWEDQATATGVVSDGVTPITVKLLYRSNSAGTTTPQAPKIWLSAYRTA